MTRLILFLLFAGLSAHASEPISSSPSCSEERIVFHGETVWGEMVENAQGEEEMKLHKEKIPLPATHSIHSNQWKKIYLQVPPEKRSQVRRWNVEISSWEGGGGADAEEGNRQTQNFEFGSNEEGFYPIENMRFADVAQRNEQLLTGQLFFVIKSGSDDVCQFNMRLNGQGD